MIGLCGISNSSEFLCILPNEILLKVVNYLDEDSLCKIGALNKQLLSVAEDSWKIRAHQKLGPSLAAELKEGRTSWGNVVSDLTRPLIMTSNILATLGSLDDSGGDKPALKLINDCLRQSDAKSLKSALKSFKKLGKPNQINSRYFGSTPLEIAAVFGNVKKARLLIEYGAKDALAGRHYNSKDGVKGKSALFFAVANGKDKMVEFLLMHGARPNLNLENSGYDLPLIPSLINREAGENPNFLKCLLLLIKAWKANDGDETVCQHENAKCALKNAIQSGLAKVANLLYALGIKVELSEKEFFAECDRSIREKNLEMLKFLHEKGGGNLRDLRWSSGETFLHTAVALAADEILLFLIKEVKISPDACNSKGETYEISGRKELEKNIRMAIAHELYSFAGFYDEQSGLTMDTLQDCLKHRIDLNVPINAQGQTLLHLAVEYILHPHRYETNGSIPLLLINGANPHIQDNKGITPIKRAQNVISKAKERKWYSDEDISRAENLVNEMKKIAEDIL
jgi:ankyrin repeat protein